MKDTAHERSIFIRTDRFLLEINEKPTTMIQGPDLRVISLAVTYRAPVASLRSRILRPGADSIEANGAKRRNELPE